MPSTPKSSRRSLPKSRRPASPRPLSGPLWGTLVLLGASYLTALSPAIAAHNADSLIPVFVSLERWTLFYWQQDRFGMLLPLLAMPVRDSFQNLILQNTMSVALLLAGSTAALARVGVRLPAAWAVGHLALLLALLTPEVAFVLLSTNQSYAAALGCFGIAFRFGARTGWWPGWVSLVFMIIGAWSNAGVALFMLCTGLAACAIDRSRTAGAPLVTGAGLSIAVHAGLQRLAEVQSTRVHLAGPAAMLDAWRTFAAETWAMGLPWLWPGMAVLSMAAWSMTYRQGDEGKRARGRMLALLAGAGVYAVVMALFFEGRARHMLATVPVLTLAPLAVLAFGARRLDRRLQLAAAAGLLAALVAETGVRSPGVVRRQLLAHLGRQQAVPLDKLGVTVVTGDYWSAWPVVFAMNMMHEERTGARPVTAIAFRAETLRDRWLPALAGSSLVGIVPADDLNYWFAVGTLPALEILSSRGGFSIARVEREAVPGVTPAVP